jgi:hypothetical protein
MYALVLAALAASPAQPTTKHEDRNPLSKRLLETGLPVAGDQKVKFPAPTMPDGLDAAAQKKVIEGVIGSDYSYAEFTRNSVVAPYVMRIEDIKSKDPKLPIRGVNVWCVAYGDFKLLHDNKFLDKLVSADKGKGGGKGAPLKREDLAKRGIEWKKEDEKREGYGTFQLDFLAKVQLKGTGHAMWSRNDESVVAAAEIDPRFLNDKEFPNQWRSINKGAAQPLGPPHPWTGAGMYLKITKLKQPAGALFIEQHVIFAEPEGWFEGQNLLRSKLPLAVQDNVRTMRAELQKGK